MIANFRDRGERMARIGIMTFLILAFVSLVTYRNSASYKDEGAFK